MLVSESLPVAALTDLVEMAISHYSDVRVTAQDLLTKLFTRTAPESHKVRGKDLSDG